MTLPWLFALSYKVAVIVQCNNPNLLLTISLLNAILYLLEVLCVLRILPARNEEAKYHILK